MSHFAYPFPFYLGGPIQTEDANGCWIGVPSEFEWRLLQPFPTYALEELRRRFLFVVTTTHELRKSARVVLQMAFETEAGTVLTKLFTPPAGFEQSNVCERRRYLDVDYDIRLQSFLITPALREVMQVPNIPTSYVDFLIKYMSSDYPRYRMSAIAAMLCMVKAVRP